MRVALPLALVLALVDAAHGPPHGSDKGPGEHETSGPAVGCYSGDGTDYEGGAVLTVSGSLCKEWAFLTGDAGVEHNMLPQNFCRNSDGDTRPWCFTTNTSLLPIDWEFCDIPACPSPSPPPPPPLPPSPPAAPPGLCTDTCNGQGGGAQVGICDDGVGRRAGVAGICEPGTDCSDCGVREFASPARGAPEACYNLALSAGTNDACLQSMLGNGVCDARCNTAACGFDGFDSAKLPVAFGDCGRAKIEETCVRAMYDSSRDYTSPPAQVNVSMDFDRFDLSVGLDGLLQLGFRLEVSMQWSSPNVQQTECGYALPQLLSVTRDDISISDRQKAIEQYAKTLLFLPTPVIAGAKPQASAWPQSIVKSGYSARYEDYENYEDYDNYEDYENKVVYNETLDFQLGFRKVYTYFPFDQHDLALDISVPKVLMSESCDGIVEALRKKAGDRLEHILPHDGAWLPAMFVGREQLITRTDTNLVSSCRIRIRVRRNFNTFFLKKVLNDLTLILTQTLSLTLTLTLP